MWMTISSNSAASMGVREINKNRKIAGTSLSSALGFTPPGCVVSTPRNTCREWKIRFIVNNLQKLLKKNRWTMTNYTKNPTQNNKKSKHKKTHLKWFFLGFFFFLRFFIVNHLVDNLNLTLNISMQNPKSLKKNHWEDQPATLSIILRVCSWSRSRERGSRNPLMRRCRVNSATLDRFTKFPDTAIVSSDGRKEVSIKVKWGKWAPEKIFYSNIVM